MGRAVSYCPLPSRFEYQIGSRRPRVPSSPSPAKTHRLAVCCAVLVLAVRGASFAGVNTWTTQGPGGGLLARIAIDPSSPATLYAGTQVGLFKSTNGGGAWTAMSGLILSIRCLAIDPQTPATLYAGIGDDVFGGGVFKSTDAGASWS